MVRKNPLIDSFDIVLDPKYVKIWFKVSWFNEVLNGTQYNFVVRRKKFCLTLKVQNLKNNGKHWFTKFKKLT